MKTIGDKILDVSLSKIGSKSLFTKELELALENKHVDMVVHSLKDLPTTLPEGLVIGAVCSRENPCDAVIVHPKHKDSTLKDLAADSVIGTSSLRRVAQLKRRYPHLKFECIRGNLNTRLKKLEDDDKYDAIVLAAAGVIRMGWGSKISEYLEHKDCMYAVGQGALAIECRESDSSTLELLAPLNHVDTLICVAAERALMKSLEGGCSVPLAVHCEIKDENLVMRGGVWSLDGSEELVEFTSCSFEDVKETEKEEKLSPSVNSLVSRPECRERLRRSYDLGVSLAKKLLAKGAKKILDEAKAANILPVNAPPPKVKNDLASGNGEEVKVASALL
ncbi:UNVERIFIED_CONTAM: hypothetical protein GTU68_000718 [Idotea baltica]|nr:hypothetical protein [Idotea baltica]